ncbi:sugar phosphate isomerase/epimerase family protein [Streptomyces boncukensis]|uniref:Sugar phosphate isomerase/epimerase n=1 Tax=Streptomyces boncukensis TaxID=2711219 RepID=A0A6G4WQ17_9ACTN|nr:sugar phosphate isomerase/epimerase family protein [Streptomyces boncukensis]NGO67359.1 sugar phosphate isomerase/epimerase [Streptomyces boncukensis]
MRLAFSTLGAPGLPLPDVLRLAAGSGFHGVELRAHPEEPVHPGIGLAERVDVVERFRDAGIEILTVAGYPRVAEPGADAPVLSEVRALLELARDLGARYVRVFPGGGEAPTAQSDEAAVRRLAQAAPMAADLGVRVLLETHDSHPAGADVARVLRAVAHPAAGALWDVMHTWRAGEPSGKSYAELADHLAYVQVKDIGAVDDTTPLAPGDGVLPLAEVAALVAPADVPVDWLCWEYEKRWYPDVPELAGELPRVRDHLTRLLAAAA